MTQEEIYRVLMDRRQSGDEEFYKASQVEKILKELGINGTARCFNIAYKLSQLARYGYLERRLPNAHRLNDRRFWECSYRAAKKEE